MLYRQGRAMGEHIKTEIDKMLAVDVIASATSKRASLAVSALQKDSTVRLCVDYRPLNTKKLSDAYPLFRIEDFIVFLGETAVCSTLDCSSGYWQVLAT